MLRTFFSADKSRHTELVELAYRCMLHRAPDAEGLANYTAQLRSGQLTAEGLLSSLMNSDEFLALSGKLAADAVQRSTAAPLALPPAVRQLSEALAAMSDSASVNFEINGRFCRLVCNLRRRDPLQKWGVGVRWGLPSGYLDWGLVCGECEMQMDLRKQD